MSDRTLRRQLIRLAHSNPELRAELLPLLKTAGWATKTHIKTYVWRGRDKVYRADYPGTDGSVGYYEITLGSAIRGGERQKIWVLRERNPGVNRSFPTGDGAHPRNDELAWARSFDEIVTKTEAKLRGNHRWPRSSIRERS